MLSEFYLIILVIISLLPFFVSMDKTIKKRGETEKIMHKAIYGYFMYNRCTKTAICKNNEINIPSLYSVKIRKPGKALRTNDLRKDRGITGNTNGYKEMNNEKLQNIYTKLEKTIKNNSDE